MSSVNFAADSGRRDNNAVSVSLISRLPLDKLSCSCHLTDLISQSIINSFAGLAC